MFISWLEKLSLIDYPSKICCVVFTPGCNLRCRFCHNKEFVLPEEIKKIHNSFMRESEFFSFLKRRQWLLDGVSICGGEPTIQPSIQDFCAQIKSMGFLVKLDTNGSYPHKIKKLIHEWLIDYIAMDIKHIWEKYPSLVGGIYPVKNYQESIDIIGSSPSDREFRTTLIKNTHSFEDIRQIASTIPKQSAYFLQNYRSAKILDPSFHWESFQEEEIIPLIQEFKANGMTCGFRN